MSQTPRKKNAAQPKQKKLKINTNTPKAAKGTRPSQPSAEPFRTDKGPVKRDPKKGIVDSISATAEEREKIRASNISKKSKTSKPAITKSKP